MTELGAVFAGIFIGIVLMVIVCAVLFAYTRLMNKIKYFIDRERKAYAAMKDGVKRRYDELEARVSTLEKNPKSRRICLDFDTKQVYCWWLKGGTGMDFFKEFYNGNIDPAEEIAVSIADDPKYKMLSANLSQTAARLKDQDEEIQQLVAQYRDSFELLISLHEHHAFKVGFIRGAELKQAITKTNNEPSV